MKDMTKMRSAAPAFHLRPLHPISVIGQIDNAALADRLIEAWPAATALELRITPEKRVAAHRAVIRADLVVFLQRTAVRPLRSLLPGNIIDIFRQNVLSLIISHIHRGRVGVRIDRVVCFAVRIHFFYFGSRYISF